MIGFLGDDPPDFVDFQVYRGGVVNDVHLFDADVNIADYYGEVGRFFGVLLGSVSGVYGADGDASVGACPLKLGMEIGRQFAACD